MRISPDPASLGPPRSSNPSFIIPPLPIVQRKPDHWLLHGMLKDGRLTKGEALVPVAVAGRVSARMPVEALECIHPHRNTPFIYPRWSSTSRWRTAEEPVLAFRLCPLIHFPPRRPRCITPTIHPLHITLLEAAPFRCRALPHTRHAPFLVSISLHRIRTRLALSWERLRSPLSLPYSTRPAPCLPHQGQDLHQSQHGSIR